ncbi:2,3-diaminopropionate biosynthesis protein SbnA [Lysinibacillus macroides]|uniref:N-(2-amino-2-carboxyethyl)-L-glutamate synthase n=1 Tax=Lysinibacillus macroides TaxID=33935 RepID=A0A0M9DI62_9BACI|nr:2,3-diaminopropionate biosynthesis protein SbnA [Lysinibacillus macroides]KOY81379.1 cystathionine beta-synthase [Lysinibacillus macroides]QPR68448.1 2,3-diaminopropionate biosynthesis protein SbnA [Lysinibacillus macroides]
MIYYDVLELIGSTPIVKLKNITGLDSAQIFLKLEGYNPGGSMKDRVAKAIIENAEVEGKLEKGGTIIESSSGNLAIGLAIMSKQKGYRMIAVVDPKISHVNLSLIKAYGGEVYMVNEPDSEGNYLKKRIETAKRLSEEINNCFWPNQYNNYNNPKAHEENTALEIFNDFQGDLNWLVAPVGTAGLATGCALGLKKLIKDLKVLAVDAVGSVTFGTQPGKRLQTGIGAAIVPQNVRPELYDQVEHVDDENAFYMTRRLAMEEGLLVGGSTGSAVHAALELSRRLNKSEKILVISPDRGDRYFNTIFSNEWLERNGIFLKGKGLTVV